MADISRLSWTRELHERCTPTSRRGQQRLLPLRDKHFEFLAVIVSAGAFHSPAAAIIANGSGWVVSSSRMECLWWVPMACLNPASALCNYHSAKYLTRGTRLDCAGQAATISL